MDVKYPEVEVELSGQDGNAFAILGRVARALKQAGTPKEDLDAFVEDAMSGDYNHVLQTVMKTVTVS